MIEPAKFVRAVELATSARQANPHIRGEHIQAVFESEGFTYADLLDVIIELL